LPFFHGTMITAVVMVGEMGGGTQPTAWVQAARRAATRDRLDLLAKQNHIDQLVLVSPQSEALVGDYPVNYIPSPQGPIHFGRYLTEVCLRYPGEGLLYFGGGSAPLLGNAQLEEIIRWLATTDRGIITNNRFASDWAGFAPTGALPSFQERLPKDNMLGWVLWTEAGFPVRDLPPSAASRLDIDTPTDLLFLRHHPGLGRHLRQCLEQLPLDTKPLEQVVSILKRPASRLFIGGRLSPEPWQALNKVTQSWIRVVSEERGMVSSGRQERGEVYSLLAEYIAKVGLEEFFISLSEQADAALIDTRVLLAHHRLWPSDTDRFASDLGLVEQIDDSWLRAFTAAATQATIPVILGGHGLLSGDLFALCDLL
jgi:hypothetical protein